MKIGVIGNGVVGHATARCFMEHAEVRVFDRDPAKTVHTVNEVLQCDIVFICIPETVLDDFFMWVGSTRRLGNYVIKSTCPIGTTRKIAEKYGLKNLVHSPEFLTARCAMTDAKLPARNIIGYPNPAGDCINPLRVLYRDRFPGVPVHEMSSDDSEAVKLFQNGFFAVKVAFFNEVNELAVKLGLDWETIRAAMLADGRIAHSHTQVPGPDGKYGFGGTCLPKDLEQLVRHMCPTIECERPQETELTICAAALNRNNHDRERKQ